MSTGGQPLRETIVAPALARSPQATGRPADGRFAIAGPDELPAMIGNVLRRFVAQKEHGAFLQYSVPSREFEPNSCHVAWSLH
jgi:hypothetical protein